MIEGSDMDVTKTEFLARLEIAHLRCAIPFRLRPESEEWIEGLLSLLLPQFRTMQSMLVQDLARQAEKLDHQLSQLLGYAGIGLIRAHEIVDEIWKVLPRVLTDLTLDAKATDEFDPASESIDEVMLAYPGFYATAIFRVAHELDLLKVPLIPRLLTEHAHRQTGIDIHPGATIGVPFIIDHGTGIVIGQSAVIGQRVKLYHGVTLGALSVKKSLAQTKRHPTVEDDVVIYSGATILGGETIIGARSVVGGNAWITKSVPPGSVITDKAKTIVSTRRP